MEEDATLEGPPQAAARAESARGLASSVTRSPPGRGRVNFSGEDETAELPPVDGDFGISAAPDAENRRPGDAEGPGAGGRGAASLSRSTSRSSSRNIVSALPTALAKAGKQVSNSCIRLASLSKTSTDSSGQRKQRTLLQRRWDAGGGIMIDRPSRHGSATGTTLVKGSSFLRAGAPSSAEHHQPAPRKIDSFMSTYGSFPVEDFDHVHESSASRHVPPLMLHPQGRFKTAWDVVLAVLILYSTLLIPYRIAFLEPAMGGWAILDWVMDAFFLCDIVTNFRTGIFVYVEPEELTPEEAAAAATMVVTYSQRIIAYRYLSSWFALDLVSTVPFDRLVSLSLGSVSSSDSTWLRSTKLLRTLRLFRLVKLMRLVKLNHFVKQLEEKDVINPSLIRFIKLILGVLLFAHYMACLLMFGATNNDDEDSLSWVELMGFAEQDKARQWELAMYWAFTTMTTVGYGEVKPSLHRLEEVLVVMSAELLGIVVFGYIIGTMTSLSQSFDVRLKLYREKMSTVGDFMHSRKIDRVVQQRVRSFYEYYYERKSVFDEERILSEVSNALRIKMAYHSHKKVLGSLPYMANKKRAFVGLLGTVLQPFPAEANDVICFEGVVSMDMYWIVTGNVVAEVSKEDDWEAQEVDPAAPEGSFAGHEVAARLGAGDHFGEVSLLMNIRQPATCVASGHCDMLWLSREGMEKVLVSFPRMRQDLLSLARSKRHESKYHTLQYEALKEAEQAIKEEATERARVVAAAAADAAEPGGSAAGAGTHLLVPGAVSGGSFIPSPLPSPGKRGTGPSEVRSYGPTASDVLKRSVRQRTRTAVALTAATRERSPSTLGVEHAASPLASPLRRKFSGAPRGFGMAASGGSGGGAGGAGADDGAAARNGEDSAGRRARGFGQVMAERGGSPPRAPLRLPRCSRKSRASSEEAAPIEIGSPDSPLKMRQTVDRGLRGSRRTNSSEGAMGRAAKPSQVVPLEAGGGGSADDTRAAGSTAAGSSASADAHSSQCSGGPSGGSDATAGGADARPAPLAPIEPPPPIDVGMDDDDEGVPAASKPVAGLELSIQPPTPLTMPDDEDYAASLGDSAGEAAAGAPAHGGQAAESQAEPAAEQVGRAGPAAASGTSGGSSSSSRKNSLAGSDGRLLPADPTSSNSANARSHGSTSSEVSPSALSNGSGERRGAPSSQVSDCSRLSSASRDFVADRLSDRLTDQSRSGRPDLVRKRSVLVLDQKALHRRQLIECRDMLLIHPQEVFKLCWDVFLSVLICYSSLVVPYRVFMVVAAEGSVRIFELCIDCVFMFDVLVNFRTAYFDDAGVLVTSPTKIAQTYSRSWFVVDVLSSLPLDFLLESEDGGDFSVRGVDVSPRIVSLLRMLRLVRLLKLARLLKLSKILGKMQEEGWINPSTLELTKLIIYLMLMVHLAGCMWHYCAVVSVEEDNWMLAAGVEDLSKMHKYFLSIYWALTTMSTIGYGDIVARNQVEYWAAIIVMLIGASIFGVVIGGMTDLVDNLDPTGSRLRERMANVKEYLWERQYPKVLQKQIVAYYNTYLNESGEIDVEQQILSELPPPLRTEIMLSLNKRIIDSVEFLKERDAQFIVSVCNRLKPMFAAPLDVIYTEGDVGLEMYMVQSGELKAELNVPDEDEPKLFEKYGPGSHFGELSIFLPDRAREATVTAETFCSLFVFSKKDLDSLLPFYPEVKADLQQKAEEKLAKLSNISDVGFAVANANKFAQRLLHVARSSSMTHVTVEASSDAGVALPDGVSEYDEDVMIHCRSPARGGRARDANSSFAKPTIRTTRVSNPAQNDSEEEEGDVLTVTEITAADIPATSPRRETRSDAGRADVSAAGGRAAQPQRGAGAAGSGPGGFGGTSAKQRAGFGGSRGP